MPSILITGAASGIGKATAELFHQKGWIIGLADVNKQGLKNLAEKLGAQNTQVLDMDVTDPESIQSAYDAFTQQTDGSIDVLFNCAGILAMGDYESIPLETQRRIIDINVNGILNCTHLALPFLKRSQQARVVMMSSASAVYGTPQLAVYSASKHAVKALTEALSIELEPEGIIVSDIMVPYVDTPMVNEAEHQATSVKRLGVHVKPEDVAQKVWQAANGKKVHWLVGINMRLLNTVNWAFPYARRFLIKSLAN